MHEDENFEKFLSMTTNVTRGEKLLQRWAANPAIELTQEGKDWLIASLDPFHDTQLQHLEGYPDLETSSSVVQLVKQSMQISAISGGGATPVSTWSMHLVLFPWLNKFPFTTTDARNNNGIVVGDIPPTALLGGLCARRTDTDTMDWFPAEAGDTNNLGQLTLDGDFSNGLSRIIGVGFEVYDTTADLVRQGSCTTWRQSEPRNIPATWNVSTVGDGVEDEGEARMGAFSGTPMRAPPINQRSAMLLPGSRQWRSADGCYVVGAFHDSGNPPQPVNYCEPILYDASVTEDQISFPLTTNTGTIHLPSPNFNFSAGAFFVGTDEVGIYPPIMPPVKLYPYHMCGAIFSGLNPLSNYTINLNVYVERFPSIHSSALSVLATPSPNYDPMALEIYSHALQKLPVSVMVKENGLGSWFLEAIKSAAPFVSSIASAIGGPIGAIASTAIPHLVTWADSALGEKAVVRATKTRALKRVNKPPKRRQTKLQNDYLRFDNRGPKGKVSGPFEQPPGYSEINRQKQRRRAMLGPPKIMN